MPPSPILIYCIFIIACKILCAYSFLKVNERNLKYKRLFKQLIQRFYIYMGDAYGRRSLFNKNLVIGLELHYIRVQMQTAKSSISTHSYRTRYAPLIPLSTSKCQGSWQNFYLSNAS